MIVIFVFALAAGDVDLEDGFESDINRPAAEGGSFGVPTLEGGFEFDADVGTGVTINSGVCDKARE